MKVAQLSNLFLRSAFPGFEPSAQDGAVEPEQMRAVAKSLISERFATCVAALLFGSAKQGEWKAFSDLDLLLIMPAVTIPSKYCLVYNGFLIEVYVYDRRSITGALHLDRPLNPNLVPALLEGETIWGNEEDISELRSLAQKTSVIARKTPVDSTGLAMTRALATSMMVELATNESFVERLYYGSQLYTLLAGFLVRQRTGCFHWQKWVVRKLTESDPGIALQFHDALVELAVTQSPAELLIVSNVVLDQIGGPLWSGYVSPL